MNEAATPSAPKWFKSVAIVAIIWNLLGLSAFVADVTTSEEAIEKMDEPMQQLFENRPAWAVAAFAVAVVAGTVGSVLLLMKSKMAQPVLVISLIGVVVQNVYSFQSGAFEVYGRVAMIMSGLVFAIGFFLILLARKGQSEGWIR